MDFFTPTQVSVFSRLILAVLLGSAIGIERTLAHRLAGFRTFAMVSLGACAFTLIGQAVFENVVGGAGDPLRVASQIVVGIGFLAGGLIVLNKDTVHGLTTGAGLWVAGSIGMATGFGLYSIAISVTILTVLIFGLFWHVEQKIVASKHEHQE